MPEHPDRATRPETLDRVAHLTRQMVFSKATFGPGPRTEGVIDRIRKELEEVLSDAQNLAPGQTFAEWVDVVILALDGLTRSLWAADEYRSPAEQIAREAAGLVLWKQGVNERRNWPDWRTAPAGKAIEHDRSGEAPAPVAKRETLTEAPILARIAALDRKAPCGSHWRHVASGTLYEVLGQVTLEFSCEPAVLYRRRPRTGERFGVLPEWVRPASEFLDGRFVRHEGDRG